jgi:SAM-dependent methyltransferase
VDRFRNTRQPDWDWWGKLWPAPGETLRDLDVTPGTTLVEIGAGDGYFALPAARIADPATVYALDLDASLLDDLRRVADRQEIDNVEPVGGDARNLSDHLPEPVDVALLANAMHGVEQTGDLASQVYDSLGPGGRFVVVNWVDRDREKTTVAGEPRGPPTDLRLSPAETENAVLAGADFSLERSVALPPYHYALTFER